MFPVLLGVLAGVLNVISYILLLVLIIPAIVWIYRTRHAIMNYTDADEWLDVNPKMKEAGAARKSFQRMAIWEFRNLDRKRKLAIFSITLVFMLTTSWLIWETYPFQNYTDTVLNDDVRVFWEAVANQSTKTLTIKGANNPLLDARRCRVYYILPFAPVTDGTVNITSSWNLDYMIEGYATLSVGSWLYDDDADPLESMIVFSTITENGSDKNSTSLYTDIHMDWICYSTENYYIGIDLTVSLTGSSSVEATLSISSLNATTI